MKPYASFSPCRRYRYDLIRSWTPVIVPLGSPRPQLAVVMLNPSTADEETNDPTIRRVLGFADAWGYGSLVVLNLFALRATDPICMMIAGDDPVGPQNDEFLLQHLAAFARAGLPVLAAWGIHGSHLGRDAAVMRLVAGVNWHCLGTTKNGSPRHPLYVKATQPLVPFAAKAGGP